MSILQSVRSFSHEDIPSSESSEKTSTTYKKESDEIKQLIVKEIKDGYAVMGNIKDHEEKLVSYGAKIKYNIMIDLDKYDKVITDGYFFRDEDYDPIDRFNREKKDIFAIKRYPYRGNGLFGNTFFYKKTLAELGTYEKYLLLSGPDYIYTRIGYFDRPLKNDVLNYVDDVNRNTDRGAIDELLETGKTNINPTTGGSGRSSGSRSSGRSDVSDVSGRSSVSGGSRFDEELVLVDYSDKSFAVFGNTKRYKDELLKKGRYNPNLMYNGRKTPGFIFSNKHYDEIRSYIDEINMKYR